MLKTWIITYWQDIVVWILFAVVIACFGYRLVLKWKTKKPGCGSDCLCSGKKPLKR